MLELLRGGRGVESWVPTGDVARLRFKGDEILVAVERDWDEMDRRRRHGLGALTHRRALQLLLSMPPGVAVPLGIFRNADQRLLRVMPEGVVEFVGPDVCASLRPAVSLRSVGVVASSWKQGLRDSGPFASYCARYVVVDGYRERFDAAVAAIEARYYGVGLALRRDGHLDWLVSPAPFHADRFTAASWLMAEHMTEALSEFAN